MPTPTYKPLANITLGSSAASVTFSSISQAYRDLIIVIEATGSTQQQSYLRFNSDTGNNYNAVYMYGNGSSTGSGSGANTSFTFLYTATGYRKLATLQVMDYSATDKHKTWLQREDGATLDTQAIAGRWANTAAVTSVALVRVGGNFETGSTFSLFGVAA